MSHNPETKSTRCSHCGNYRLCDLWYWRGVEPVATCGPCRLKIESGVTLTFESDRWGLVWVYLETAAGKFVALTPHAAHILARLITRHCPPPEARHD